MSRRSPRLVVLAVHGRREAMWRAGKETTGKS
jgi:hypothetical protein